MSADPAKAVSWTKTASMCYNEKVPSKQDFDPDYLDYLVNDMQAYLWNNERKNPIETILENTQDEILELELTHFNELYFIKILNIFSSVKELITKE